MPCFQDLLSRGQATEEAWSRILRNERGLFVMETWHMNVSPRIVGPGEIRIVMPDLLVFEHDGTALWHEVKDKADATWRRLPPGPCWETSLDYTLFREYGEVQCVTGLPVLLVFHESASPVDVSCQSAVTGPAQWLSISLDNATALGRHEPTWPGGRADCSRRGTGGLGGWLIPRDALTVEEVFDGN